MPFRGWWSRAKDLSGVSHSRGLTVTADEWSRCAADVAAGGGRLLAMWASDCIDGQDEGAGADAVEVHAAFMADPGLLILELPVQRNAGPEAMQADYPGIERFFPCASRMQRAMVEISGLRSSDPDSRSWLRHLPDGQELIRVSGEGVHEIAVGPVHAGTIEPGHFRFSVVGEKVLRLEEHFGYTHKGIERR
ncbi:MAG: Ni,Fe-hydrogenase III large subunit, partial [Proteobacteria bacterium]|nr:Ni,Fe-hydrogenase III large subunit [Pseudomonadota bacterium]